MICIGLTKEVVDVFGIHFILIGVFGVFQEAIGRRFGHFELGHSLLPPILVSLPLSR